MNSFNILEKFKKYFYEENCTEGLATVKSLRDLINNCSATTITEYGSLLNHAIEELFLSDFSLAPIKSASELFMRYITFCKLDNNFEESKSTLLKKADLFINKISKSVNVIAYYCRDILNEATNLLIFGGSKVVWETLIAYVKENPRKEINIYILGSPIESYILKMSKLSNCVSFVEVDHRSVGHYLKNIDVAVFGAEAVMGNGGIINEFGTFSAAILAETFHVPIYVLSESIRLTRLYPLSDADIPLEFQFKTSVRHQCKDLGKLLPDVDYTKPEYIHMIVTDIGCMPPANISQEIFKLYL